MFLSKVWVKLLVLFAVGILSSCSILQFQPINTHLSAYAYLTKEADRHQQGNKLSFLLSYKTVTSNNDFDRVLQNVAFTYDNAVAALAFIAAKDQRHAKQIVDTLIYAKKHDRFYKDDRIRNAYWGDKNISSSGSVPLPGWFNNETGRWIEDEFQISSHTGSVAWAMLAFLGYYQTFGGDIYFTAAKEMGEWIEQNCRDSRGAGGYMGGFNGWEPNPTLLKYKSTEHNIDLYAAFERLHEITGNQMWHERANHAKNFVIAMWDKAEKKFWTGTQVNGVTVNKDVIPLDVQAWAILVLGELGKPYWQCLEYAEKYHRVGQGFDYNQDRDGIWYEGTAQMASAYQVTKQLNKSNSLISTLKVAQDISGGIPAADRDKVTTGFAVSDHQLGFYFHRLHLGTTAWFVLAEKQVNPFWIGSKKLSG